MMAELSVQTSEVSNNINKVQREVVWQISMLDDAKSDMEEMEGLNCSTTPSVKYVQLDLEIVASVAEPSIVTELAKQKSPEMLIYEMMSRLMSAAHGLYIALGKAMVIPSWWCYDTVALSLAATMIAGTLAKLLWDNLNFDGMLSYISQNLLFQSSANSWARMPGVGGVGLHLIGQPLEESSISMIVEMGFFQVWAEETLSQLDDNSVEMAMEWLFSHPEEIL
ncbi:unnamed protein product [Sphagnum troendelagicum]|uniref:UBA domain-containing protein n=1 Tax=Sphagnum troendelagicum TaxID=128251 RepID=A0ABP0U990_9BRYO